MQDEMEEADLLVMAMLAEQANKPEDMMAILRSIIERKKQEYPRSINADEGEEGGILSFSTDLKQLISIAFSTVVNKLRSSTEYVSAVARS